MIELICCKPFLCLFTLHCSSWPHQLLIVIYAMSVAIEVCKYKLISSCIIDRWLMMHKSTLVTCTYSCYSHPLPSQCLHLLTPQQQLCIHGRLWTFVVLLASPCCTVFTTTSRHIIVIMCTMCFCQAELFHCAFTIELMQLVARCFTDELDTHVCVHE